MECGGVLLRPALGFIPGVPLQRILCGESGKDPLESLYFLLDASKLM